MCRLLLVLFMAELDTVLEINNRRTEIFFRYLATDTIQRVTGLGGDAPVSGIPESISVRLGGCWEEKKEN